MPVTVIEQIAIELQTRLELLTDIDSDYTTKVIEVIRPPQRGVWTPQDLQIVLTQGSSTVIDNLSYPGNPPAIARRQVFNIRCHLLIDERSDDMLDEQINTFAADVISVVTSETNWHNFNNLAIDARFIDFEQVDEDGGVAGVNVPIEIIYRTNENDPYTVRA